MKHLLWVGSSKRDLMEMPNDVIDDFGYGLYQAQMGKHPDSGKTLTGFGGASVVELVEDHRGDTFRAVYTVKFADAIIVLHAFQKKSKKGKETPKKEMDLVHQGSNWSKRVYKEWKRQGGKNNG